MNAFWCKYYQSRVEDLKVHRCDRIKRQPSDYNDWLGFYLEPSIPETPSGTILHTTLDGIGVVGRLLKKMNGRGR